VQHFFVGIAAHGEKIRNKKRLQLTQRIIMSTFSQHNNTDNAVSIVNSKFNFFLEAKQSLRFSLPLITAHLVKTSSAFMSVLMVAHLSANALAAVGLSSVIYLLVLVFFFGVISATSVLVAHSFGVKNHENIGVVVQQGFLVALFFGIPLMLLLWFMPLLLPLSGQKGEVLRLATLYLHAISWSMLPLILICIMEQFLVGTGRTKLVLVFSMAQIPCEIVLMYLLIFGKFGLPVCGVAGIGYGLTVIFIIAAILIGLYLGFNQNFAIYRLFKNPLKFNRFCFFEIIRVGLPTALSYAVEVGLFAAVSFLMGRFGRDALAAHQITLQYVDFVATIIFAIAQSTAIRIGHAVSERSRAVVKRIFYVDTTVSVLIVLVAVSGYWLAPHFLIELDLNLHVRQHQEIVRYAVAFLTIAGVMLLFDSVRWVATGALRALKDTRVPMLVIGIVFWLVVLPLTYLFGLRLNFGGVGIWWVITGGVFLIALILYLRFLWLLKRVDLAQLFEH